MSVRTAKDKKTALSNSERRFKFALEQHRCVVAVHLKGTAVNDKSFAGTVCFPYRHRARFQYRDYRHMVWQ